MFTRAVTGWSHWQPESLEAIIKNLDSRWYQPSLSSKQSSKMRKPEPSLFWAQQTPWEDHQSDSNGYLIFLYGNKYQFTSNAIISGRVKKHLILNFERHVEAHHLPSPSQNDKIIDPSHRYGSKIILFCPGQASLMIVLVTRVYGQFYNLGSCSNMGILPSMMITEYFCDMS